MSDRRQAFRREPIELWLDDKTMISIGPIPWEKRNDFGNELVRQNTEIINEAVRIYVDEESGLPHLEAKLGEKFSNPLALFELGLDPMVFEVVRGLKLYQNQVVEILLVICEVNDLEKLKVMIDPNLMAPTPIGGLLSALAAKGDDTLKEESGPDSSSQDSPENQSGPSPIPNLASS